MNSARASIAFAAGAVACSSREYQCPSGPNGLFLESEEFLSLEVPADASQGDLPALRVSFTNLETDESLTVTESLARDEAGYLLPYGMVLHRESGCPYDALLVLELLLPPSWELEAPEPTEIETEIGGGDHQEYQIWNEWHIVVEAGMWLT
jgi:hypothetical protein